MQISWEPPIQPNGELEYYVIKLPSPRFEIRNVSQETLLVENLVPNTEYRVTVTACTRSKIVTSFNIRILYKLYVHPKFVQTQFSAMIQSISFISN